MVEPTERIAILLELQNQEFERRARSAANEINRLERRFNPLAAAEARLTREQTRFNAALEAGTIDAQQHARGMDLLQREYDQTAARLTGATRNVIAMNSAVAAQTGFMTRNRSIIQQAGFQVGDFAVQVQGGQSALVAFSQQGSQLLGVFGPLGAVMGAVLAVGSALAGVFLNLSDANEDVRETARTFTDRLADADAALAAMSDTAGDLRNLDALRAKYGEITDEVRELAKALFEIDQRAALAEVSGVIEDITRQISEAVEASAGLVSGAVASASTDQARAEADAFAAEIDRIQADISNRQSAGFIVDQAEINLVTEMREELAALRGDISGLGSLASDLTISPEFLRGINEAQEGLVAARNAGDFSAMADRLSEIRGLLIESGEVIQQEVLDGITRSEAVAREQALRLEEGLEAANGIANADIAGNIASAATSAAALRDILREAASASGAISDLDSSNPDFFDPRGESPNAGVFNTERPNNSRRAARPAPSARTSASASASGSARRTGGRAVQVQPDLFTIAEAELEKLNRQIELLGRSRSEVAQLTTKHMLLEEAKRRGLTITEELTAKIDAEAAEVGQLAEKYDLARDRIAAVEQIQGQFRDSVIDAATGGADAFDNFTRSIKRAALEYALFGSGPFGQGGGGGGGLLGGLFGGGGGGGLFAGFFDRGGNIPAGKFGIAGERGPEIVRGPAMVTSRAETARMMQGGQGGAQIVPVEVNIINNGNSQVDQRRRKGPNGQEILDIEISRSISSGRQDQALGRFAQQPATVRR